MENQPKPGMYWTFMWTYTNRSWSSTFFLLIFHCLPIVILSSHLDQNSLTTLSPMILVHCTNFEQLWFNFQQWNIPKHFNDFADEIRWKRFSLYLRLIFQSNANWNWIRFHPRHKKTVRGKGEVQLIENDFVLIDKRSFARSSCVRTKGRYIGPKQKQKKIYSNSVTHTHIAWHFRRKKKISLSLRPLFSRRSIICIERRRNAVNETCFVL